MFLRGSVFVVSECMVDLLSGAIFEEHDDDDLLKCIDDLRVPSY